MLLLKVALLLVHHVTDTLKSSSMFFERINTKMALNYFNSTVLRCNTLERKGVVSNRK